MKRGAAFVVLVLAFTLLVSAVAFGHHMSPNPGPGLIENWDKIDLVAHGVSATQDGTLNMNADVSTGPHGGM
ncbi:MAG TPA: hypothetical protein VLQ52_05690 [Coriobacteriia bacterium]|nr:hypothetical protein [Coriobacteriia bacterium]